MMERKALIMLVILMVLLTGVVVWNTIDIQRLKNDSISQVYTAGVGNGCVLSLVNMGNCSVSQFTVSYCLLSVKIDDGITVPAENVTFWYSDTVRLSFDFSPKSAINLPTGIDVSDIPDHRYLIVVVSTDGKISKRAYYLNDNGYWVVQNENHKELKYLFKDVFNQLREQGAK